MKRLLAIFLIATSLTIALSKEIIQDKSYKIKNADNVVLNKNMDKYILNMNGNVNFIYGQIEFFCDKSTIVEQNETAKLFNNVIVKKDTLTITSDYAYYNNLQEIVQFSGNVIASEYDPNMKLKRVFQADTLVYNRKLEKITASKNVIAQELSENIFASSGYLEYHRNEGYGFMNLDPILENKKDSLTISSEKMEYHANFDKVLAMFNVETKLNEADIFSNFLIYYNEEGKAVFTGQPKIETDFGLGSAETFNLFFVENNLSHVEFINDCRLDFSFQEEQDFNNWLIAEKIDIFFEEKKPKSMLAETNVIYEIISEEERENSKDYSRNQSSSNKLQVVFTQDNEIEEINQLENIKGTYIFKSAPKQTK
jgi:lipopolysaccharide export system protein LptA